MMYWVRTSDWLISSLFCAFSARRVVWSAPVHGALPHAMLYQPFGLVLAAVCSPLSRPTLCVKDRTSSAGAEPAELSLVATGLRHGLTESSRSDCVPFTIDKL